MSNSTNNSWMITLIMAQLYHETLNNHPNHILWEYLMIWANVHNIIRTENIRIQYFMYSLSVIWNIWAQNVNSG